MNVAEYLELLGITDDEFVGMLWKRGEAKSTAVMPSSAVQAIAEHQIPREADAYLAPNPTAGPVRMNKGRGTEEQVTRIAALYADLDVKPGACPDIDAAHGIIDELSSLLAERPGAIIFSGGGLQPIWLLDNCEPATGIAVLKRFGRLTKVVGQMRNIALDSVFDAARVLRIPGTLNHKYGTPIEVLIIPDSGAPMDPATVSERLDEAGIWEDEDDRQIGKPKVVAGEALWPIAIQSCGYSAVTIREWATESVTERHPWYLSQSIRLECMRRNGCLTKADYAAAKMMLENRFTSLLATQEPKRKAARMEVRDICNESIDRASRKSAEQLDRELGKRDGSGHVHLAPSAQPPQPEAETSPEAASGAGIDTVDELEQGFWQSRESLGIIYTAALTRMCSPWAVLACCVASVLALVRPNCMLPPLVGSKGSLNWFGAVVAHSGGGKGSSLSVARDLVKDYVYQRNLGSGEGMVTAYKVKESDECPSGTRESVMFTSDEVDNVAALGSRNGSTLLPTLRSAFCGETLGFSYAGSGKNIHLDAHTYRLTLICGVQPGRAGTILNDDAGGTPQRFMWFPSTDQRITRTRAEEYQWQQFGLATPAEKEWLYPREIILPKEAESYILDARVSAMTGAEDSLDGHAVFAREKFAYALALLDGRVQMSLEDWELSGIASAVSAATRDWVAGQLGTSQRRDADRRGEIKGWEAGATDEAKAARTQDRTDRIAGWILDRLKETNGQGVSNRDLTQAAFSRDRAYMQTVLSLLVGDGQIVGTPGPKGGMIWRRA